MRVQKIPQDINVLIIIVLVKTFVTSLCAIPYFFTEKMIGSKFTLREKRF